MGIWCGPCACLEGAEAQDLRQRERLAEDRHPGRYVLHRETATERIVVGRVFNKRLGGDEMGERVRLVIDGVDRRVHHIEMDAARVEDVGRGMIVVAGSAPPGPRAADHNILDIAGQGGVYRPSDHLERARSAIDQIGGNPEAFVRSHVRRLEAIRSLPPCHLAIFGGALSSCRQRT